MAGSFAPSISPVDGVESAFHGMRFEALRLRIARVVWLILTPLALGMFAVALPARYDQLRAESAQYRLALARRAPGALPPPVVAWLSSRAYAPVMLALEIGVMLVCAAAAMLLFWRRHDERMAILASFSLVTYGALFLPPLDALARAHPTWAVFASIVQAFGLESSLLLFYISPDGHFAPRWTRPLAVIWTLWTVAGVVAPSAPFVLAHGRPHVATPHLFPLPWLLVCMTWWSTGLVAQVVRYRHISTPLQQQQTKWVLIGWTAVVAFYAALVFPRVTLPSVSAPGPLDLLYRGVGVPTFEIVMLAAPLTITISMLRYRLWQADIVINRAVVYGMVMLALGLFYAVLVIVLEAVFRSAIGQSSVLAIILALLVSASLFQQAQQRIQRVVDRRFYRRKYDAARLIEEFGAGVREEVELDALLNNLMAVAQQSTQPAHISVTLMPVRLGPHPERRDASSARSVAQVEAADTLAVGDAPRRPCQLAKLNLTGFPW